MSKKIIIYFVICAMGIAIYATAGNAGNDYGLDATAGRIGYDTAANNVKASIPGWVGLVVGGALSLLGLIFLGLMLFAGVRWMTAQGNEEYVKKAKDIMEAAIIGLVLVLAAYAISSFVLGRLRVGGGETTVEIELPDGGAGAGEEPGAEVEVVEPPAVDPAPNDRVCCVLYRITPPAGESIAQCILGPSSETERACNELAIEENLTGNNVFSRVVPDVCPAACP